MPDSQHAANARLRIGLVLFVATFLVYWLSGPMGTAFDFQLSQANNIIHGHLDMTEEYSHNLGILERVLYDGKGFCLPINDPRGEQAASEIENPRFSADCKHYMQHSLGPALLEVPLAFFFGLTVNQTLVSAFIGALTAPIVFGITRRFSNSLRTQLALTVLALFGTQFWYSAADGSVWHFAHATAVFFMFGAIYATVVARKAWLAGALVGAAFMCRPTEILAGIFPLVAFSDAWLVSEPGKNLLRRIRLRPLVELAAGVAPFILLTMLINALRFGNPFESGYSYTEQVYQTGLNWVYTYGIFDPRYIVRHVQVFWEAMPNVATTGSFVWPNWSGMALWATSPPLFYGLFIHLRRIRARPLLIGLAVAAACAFLIAGAFSTGLGFAKFGPSSLPLGLDLMAVLAARCRRHHARHRGAGSTRARLLGGHRRPGHCQLDVRRDRLGAVRLPLRARLHAVPVPAGRARRPPCEMAPRRAHRACRADQPVGRAVDLQVQPSAKQLGRADHPDALPQRGRDARHVHPQGAPVPRDARASPARC